MVGSHLPYTALRVAFSLSLVMVPLSARSRKMANNGLRRRSATHSPWYAALTWNFLSSVIGASLSHIVNVAIQLKDADGNTLVQKGAAFVYLSSDAAGLVQATAPAQGVTIGSNGLALVDITGVSFQVISDALGRFDFNIAVNAGGTYYMNIIKPDGSVQTVGPIVVA